MLLKYLTDNNIPVTNNNFTKNTLVEQVIEFWRNPDNFRYSHHSHHHQQQQEQPQAPPSQIYNQHQIETDHNRAENFPINVMSRTFCNWFYKNFNENNIQTDDFWSDCSCIVKMIDSSGDIKEDSTITSRLVLNLLYSIKGQFNFFFNPNLSHEGTRGK